MQILKIYWFYKEQNDKINALFLKHKVSDIEDLLKIKEELSLEKNSFEDIENKIAQLEKKEIAEASQSLLKKLKFYLKIEKNGSSFCRKSRITFTSIRIRKS